MKLGLVVPDGLGVRNFVHGRFLRVARAKACVPVIFSGLPEQRLRQLCARSLADADVAEMSLYRESLPSRYLRKAAEIAQQTHYGTPGMKYALARMRVSGWSKSALFNRAAASTGKAAASLRCIDSLGLLHERSAARDPLVQEYRRLLEQHAPDIVFVTHQRPPQMVPLVLAAQQLSIPTAAFIFSWDNLTSKGRTPVVFDHYLVWSELMRREMARFYPRIPSTSVHVVGTPQFEPYAYEEFGWKEETFVGELGLSGTHRRLCFSGGDESTSPNDPAYLSILAEANRAGEFGETLEIVVRPSPAENGSRYRSVLKRYPELHWSPPRWEQTRAAHPEPWSQRTPSAADIDLLKSLIVHCSLNVNVASTMTLDFASLDRPVLNLAFDPPADARRWHDDRPYYGFDHYRPVIELEGVRLVRSRRELAEAVRDSLQNPGADAAGRRALVDLQVGAPLKGTSERIVEVLRVIGGAA